MSVNRATEVSAAEAIEALKRGSVLIDVRTPAEFGEVHVDGAINIPLGELSSSELSRRYPSRPVYFSCKSGARGRQAAAKAMADGRGEVYCVTGGVESFAEAGATLIRGRKAMSLERQVRIGAGSLVLLGTILALAVHVGFLLITAFVGAGLVFAGVTDRCGMGLLLARMPWNRGGHVTCAANARVVQGG